MAASVNFLSAAITTLIIRIDLAARNTFGGDSLIYHAVPHGFLASFGTSIPHSPRGAAAVRVQTEPNQSDPHIVAIFIPLSFCFSASERVYGFGAHNRRVYSS